jgi:hypothetical protein
MTGIQMSGTALKLWNNLTSNFHFFICKIWILILCGVVRMNKLLYIAYLKGFNKQ